MGEAGDDVMATGVDGSKQLIGGPGDDFMSANVGSGRVDFVGGDGQDEGFLFAQTGSAWVDVSVSLDDQPNDGPAGGTSNWHSDVEDIFTAGGSDTITGSPGPNTIRSDANSNGNGLEHRRAAGNDTIDPGGGADHVYAGGGDDTIMARDGAADAINCGSNVASTFSPGLPPVDSDTVTGDAVDAFVSCENVLDAGRYNRPRCAPAGPEDQGARLGHDPGVPPGSEGEALGGRARVVRRRAAGEGEGSPRRAGVRRRRR